MHWKNAAMPGALVVLCALDAIAEPYLSIIPGAINIYNKIKILLTSRVNCHFINEIYYF